MLIEKTAIVDGFLHIDLEQDRNATLRLTASEGCGNELDHCWLEISPIKEGDPLVIQTAADMDRIIKALEEIKRHAFVG